MTLRFEVTDHVATITLDRPERKNAFTVEMLDAWVKALESATADDQVRVVVLTGAGDAFCSGIDLSGLEAGGRGIDTARPQEASYDAHPPGRADA
jgi:enoyl-CoA hydratase/carnithine racemase